MPFSASYCSDFVLASTEYFCPDCSNISVVSVVFLPCSKLHNYFVYSLFFLTGNKWLQWCTPALLHSDNPRLNSQGRRCLLPSAGELELEIKPASQTWFSAYITWCLNKNLLILLNHSHLGLGFWCKAKKTLLCGKKQTKVDKLYCKQINKERWRKGFQSPTKKKAKLWHQDLWGDMWELQNSQKCNDRKKNWVYHPGKKSLKLLLEMSPSQKVLTSMAIVPISDIIIPKVAAIVCSSELLRQVFGVIDYDWTVNIVRSEGNLSTSL